jgi:arsenate reductase-like glutaredoxin family protein
MKKIYHLSSCDTCRRILGEIRPPADTELQDIKVAPLTEAQLERLRVLAGDYAGLFSKRARLYRQKGLHEKVLGEEDYKQLLLEHYTFLKRPVIVVDDEIFIGNSKKTVAAAAKALHS